MSETYLNQYRHCGIEWEDTWSCACNDRCPVCNKEIEPYKSELTTEADWQVVAVAETFYDEVDCNSGRRRRIYKDRVKGDIDQKMVQANYLLDRLNDEAYSE